MLKEAVMEKPTCGKALFLAAVFCLVLTFVSCSGAVTGGGSGEDTTGRFTFDLPSGVSSGASEAGDAVSVSVYKVEMVSATGFEAETVCEPSEEPVVIQDIESGLWLITVTAVGGDGAVIKKVSRNMDLAVGEEKAVSLGFSSSPAAPASGENGG